MSKLVKSKEIKETQLENILFILETDEVLNLDKLISVICLHPLNILVQLFIVLFHINST